MEISSSGCDAPLGGGTGRGVRRTTHSPPLLQVPTELLAEIFRSTLPSVDLTLNRVEARLLSYMRKLYGMRLVAKRWQEIIDGTPTFWTFVFSILPPDVNEATILRSGSGLIAIVYASTGYTRDQPAAEDFFKSWAHTFPRWSAYRGPPLSEYLDKPAPQLETVILRGEGWGNEALELLGGNATSLRHVDLAGVTIQWKAGIFTNLKAFKLDDMFQNPEAFTPTLFLDILLASPFLEQLEVMRTYGTTDTSSSYPIITLPRLRSIRFDDCHYALTGGILRQIRAPSCTQFWLHPYAAELDLPLLMAEDLCAFHEVFRTIHKRNGFSEITLNSSGFGWKSYAEEDFQDHPMFSIFIHSDRGTTSFPWVGRVIQSDPGLSISFGFRANVTQDVLESIASMRCVTRVTIGEIGREDALPSILRFIGDPLSADPSLTSLPCLRELLLDGVAWNVQNVLEMVHSRFISLSLEHVERTPLRINVIRGAFNKWGAPRPIIDLTTLIKVRETDGVEHVQFVGPEQLDGWLAITWDEEALKPVRG